MPRMSSFRLETVEGHKYIDVRLAAPSTKTYIGTQKTNGKSNTCLRSMLPASFMSRVLMPRTYCSQATTRRARCSVKWTKVALRQYSYREVSIWRACTIVWHTQRARGTAARKCTAGRGMLPPSTLKRRASTFSGLALLKAQTVPHLS